MRIAILAMFHETNTFAVERNDSTDVLYWEGDEIVGNSHPRSYIGGFAEAATDAGMELVGIGYADFRDRGGLITAQVFEYFMEKMRANLRASGPFDGVYFPFHGAMDVEAPYQDAEASLVRMVREELGDEIPCVGTYDFHSNYTEWECSALVPFPLNTNPHIDAYERGLEAAGVLRQMLAGEIQPVTRYIHVPIIGPNIGQSSWNHDLEVEKTLPVFQVNELRAELEQTPGVINLTIQGGYGYSDLPYTGMSVIATTDGDPDLADRLAKQLASALWEKREEIRTIRHIYSIDDGVRKAMEREDGLVCLVDLGDDPGSLCPADSPAVLESLLRLGAADAALTIRDANVIEAAMSAGVGAELTMEVGASIDQRFYKPLQVTGYVKSLDDGKYKIVGNTRRLEPGSGEGIFPGCRCGPRAVLRFANKVDVIFSGLKTGKDRDFFKSAGIVLEEKRIIVVKSNQAHRASFDPVVDETIELDTPGVSTVDYTRLPFQHIPRPLYPIDMDTQWEPE